METLYLNISGMTCGGCAQLLRAGRPAGCVLRDRDVYKPEVLK